MQELSPLATVVRTHDPDRFLTALFAPRDRRETLFTLYAFNHELARAREVTSEPMLALIRLQWWREVVEGERRRHEIATPLGEALDSGRLDAATLLAMIDGRETEAAPAIETLEEWRGWLLATAGGVAAAAGTALGVADPAVLDRLRRLGAAYGVAGQLRNVPALARQGRCLLPEDLLAEHGLSVHAAIADPAAPALLAVRRALSAQGQAWLREAADRLPRAAVAAALPAVLARRDLHRIEAPARPRGVLDRLAVLSAAIRGAV